MHGGRELVREEMEVRGENGIVNDIRHDSVGNGWNGGQSGQMKNAAQGEKARAPKARASAKNAARNSGREGHAEGAHIQ